MNWVLFTEKHVSKKVTAQYFVVRGGLVGLVLPKCALRETHKLPDE